MSETAREVIVDVVRGDGDADQIIATLADAGFVIVPKEPTEEMCSSGLTEFQRDPDMPRMRDYWRAMIAAALKDK